MCLCVSVTFMLCVIASGYINTVCILPYTVGYNLLSVAVYKPLPVTTTEGTGNEVGRLLCLSVSPGTVLSHTRTWDLGQ